MSTRIKKPLSFALNMRTKFVREATEAARAEFERQTSETAAGLASGRFTRPQAATLRKSSRVLLDLARVKAKYDEMKSLHAKG